MEPIIDPYLAAKIVLIGAVILLVINLFGKTKG